MGRFPALSSCMRVISFLGICITSVIAVDHKLSTLDIASGHRPEERQPDALTRSVSDPYMDRDYRASPAKPSPQVTASDALVTIPVEREIVADSFADSLWERPKVVSVRGGEVFKL